MKRRLPLAPQVQQLDLLRRHPGRISKALDDGAGRHEMRIGICRKSDGKAAYLACRSYPVRHEHEGSLADPT